MPEGSVHLQGEIPVLVTKADIRTERYLWRSLSCDISISAIAEIDRSILVEVFDVVFVMPVAILNDALAMRQIEDSQRLSHYLIDDIVVTTMLTSTRKTSHRRHISRRHLHTLVLATQRKEFVLLPSQVHVDIQFHILLFDRRERDADFKTLVAHRTDVCQQLVEGERRNRHIVGIKHIGGLRIVILGGQDQSVVPQSKVGTNVPSGTSLPFQVWIVVANHAQGNRWRTIHRYDTRLAHRIHRGIRRDAAKIARATITCAEFQHPNRLDMTEPCLLFHIPS